MQLFIAEKPSVAKAIAAELGVACREEGYIKCRDRQKVTWCFGHMLEQAEPDEYTPDDVPRNAKGKKIWRTDDLPIIPKQWILKPKDDAKKQLSIIGKLIREAQEIVNAGDPDREGQLLVDEVLEHFGNKKPVRRFWVSAQDSVSIKRGLSSLHDNRTYVGWADAARARQRADWLIGMNLSRAYTLRAQRGGSCALLTVGRVQTPTLALVVSRDREIEAFKPIPYHTIRAEFRHEGGLFWANWKAREDQAGLDSEGRLTDTALANAIVQKVQGQTGGIVTYKEETKTQNQPLAFALSDITVLASKKFGYSAEQVLKICQALYEVHKLTSYPRTDCAYLPESQLEDAQKVLEAISETVPSFARLIAGADTTIRSKTWNDKKVTAHHGIIPTMHKGSSNVLSESERNVYEQIVRAYIAQFYPIHKYLHTTVEAEIVGEKFITHGKQVTMNGWRDVYTDTGEEESVEDEEASQHLPSMNRGDSAHCLNAERNDAQTKPPPYFTEGTLTRAMENIHRFISDPAHKKVLREGDGIGTSATRASIITELKRREFLEVKGKKLVSTILGRSVIDALPEVVKSPVLTALYERMLKGIEQREGEISAFMIKQEAFIVDQVAKAQVGSVTIAGGKERIAVSSQYACTACGAGLLRRPGKRKRFWWGCSAYPTCKETYPDNKGRPDYQRVQKNVANS
jgi:DNA topoisomerase III